MRPLLDPKQDLVFKLLFSRPGNEHLLVSLLNAVLRPASRIVSVTILNPGVPGGAIEDKNVVLDVAAKMQDRRLADVEMQMLKHAGVRRRVLMYWARLFEEQLDHGAKYSQLQPVVGIYLLGEPWLPTRRFHSIFRLQEVHDQSLFTDAIELHIVELRKVSCLTDQERAEHESLVRWAAFFNASTAKELQAAALGDPIMQDAKRQLEVLSADPQVRHWAHRRAIGQKLQRVILAEERREGREEGREEEGSRLVLRLLGVRFGRLPSWVEERVAAGSSEQLDRWAERLLSADSVEAVFDPDGR